MTYILGTFDVSTYCYCPNIHKRDAWKVCRDFLRGIYGGCFHLDKHGGRLYIREICAHRLSVYWLYRRKVSWKFHLWHFSLIDVYRLSSLPAKSLMAAYTSNPHFWGGLFLRKVWIKRTRVACYWVFPVSPSRCSCCCCRLLWCNLMGGSRRCRVP